MNTTVYTLVLVLVIIVLAYICAGVAPSLVRTLKRLIALFSVRSNKRRDSLVNSFLTKDHPGKSFVTLLSVGLLCTVKTINHGAQFPDDKQIEAFKRYGTSAIKEALDEIGEGI